MHRAPALRLLERYAAAFPAEAALAARIRTLVEDRADCLLRTCRPGHVTASAWIVSAGFERFLLTHHRKLDRWLQLGGHVDGETELHRSALREAREESGMSAFAFACAESEPLPLDLDVHVIPARGAEPEHEHHDFRFLLIAAPDQPLRISRESKDLRWFDDARLAEVAGDASVRRLGEKARAVLAGCDISSLRFIR